MIKKLKWTKKATIAVAVICITMATASLVIFSQVNQVAEAAILEPIESPPETIFDDDFSVDLSNWTVVSGTWAIESGELSGDSSTAENVIVAGDVAWTNYIMEARIYIVTLEASLLVQANADARNGYLIHFYDGQQDKIYKCVGGVYNLVATGSLTPPAAGQWYDINVTINNGHISVYRDGILSIEYTDSSPITGGRIGYRVDKNRHGHFDDVKVSSLAIPDAYGMNVRAGATNIVITCTWSGLGNITIAYLTNGTTTYYESDMSIYEKTTVSTGGTSEIFNIRRALVSFAPLTSSETWELYIDLSDVTPYTVSVEIS